MDYCLLLVKSEISFAKFSTGVALTIFRVMLQSVWHMKISMYAVCISVFRIRLWEDCFGRPITSAPDAWFDVVERYSNDNNKTLKRTTNISRCLNLGSYNYLGFAAADEYCTPRVIESLRKYSPSTCSSRVDAGTTALHNELEKCVADFVGKPAAIVFGMGYVTNSAILPVLIGKAYIYLDEAHSIGAVGKQEKASELIQYLKYTCPAHLYATSISPPAAEQVAVVMVAFQQPHYCWLGDPLISVDYGISAQAIGMVGFHLCFDQVGDLVGIKYFPAEPDKQQEEAKIVKLD
ncbi:hypothetical protein GH714_029567 [Hevea brasiliensis]|uniref:Aminotransferase class I/classII large domain-containing protein n=1 Tax=Hevea brasiliensis TaxID=3981 RepID=A0A6A6LK75_HEVBR|nr:hypothetical protein GH714_029567 [Hevea brasiliensis]